MAVQHLVEESSVCIATHAGDLLLWNLDTLEVRMLIYQLLEDPIYVLKHSIHFNLQLFHIEF